MAPTIVYIEKCVKLLAIKRRSKSIQEVKGRDVLYSSTVLEINTIYKQWTDGNFRTKIQDYSPFYLNLMIGCQTRNNQSFQRSFRMSSLSNVMCANSFILNGAK